MITCILQIKYFVLHTVPAHIQERLWEERVQDDLATEKDSRPGGVERAQELNPQLMHDIQVLVSRLVSKAGQLIHNLITNLAENWMHI